MTPLLAIGFGLATLMATEASPRNSMEIEVLEPGSNRLVYYAQIEITPVNGQSGPIRRGQTGLSGEPFTPERMEQLDPAWGTLLVTARKNGATASLKMTYDPDTELWNRAHSAGNWRPDMVYTYQPETRQWEGRPYSEWVAPHTARKAAFVEIDRAIGATLEKPAMDAELQTLVTAARADIEYLVSIQKLGDDLQRRLGRSFIEPALAIPQQGPIPAKLKDDIRFLRNQVATREQDTRPDPPRVNLLMPSAHTVPVNRYPILPFCGGAVGPMFLESPSMSAAPAAPSAPSADCGCH